MKNMIILGLVALLLFSVSAGLSAWLMPTKTTASNDETSPIKKITKKSESSDDKDHASKPSATDSHAKNEKSDHDSLGIDAKSKDGSLEIRDELLKTRQARFEVIQQDIRQERDALESLMKKVVAEMKLAQAVLAEVETKTAELEASKSAIVKAKAEIPKKSPESEADEKYSTQKTATMLDNMPAENAAIVVQQMADTGKLDSIVKTFGLMQERKAAGILAELTKTDPGLAAQLIEKTKGLKRPSAAGTVPPPTN